jgi:hypothetical protein
MAAKSTSIVSREPLRLPANKNHSLTMFTDSVKVGGRFLNSNLAFSFRLFVLFLIFRLSFSNSESDISSLNVE